MTTLKAIGNWVLVILLLPIYLVTAPVWLPLVIIGGLAIARMHEQMRDDEYEARFRRLRPDPLLEEVGYREESVSVRPNVSHSAGYRARQAAKLIP